MRTKHKSRRRKPFLFVLPFSGPEGTTGRDKGRVGPSGGFQRVGTHPPQAHSHPLAAGRSAGRPRLRARDLEGV